jgi:acetate kinase
MCSYASRPCGPPAGSEDDPETAGRPDGRSPIESLTAGGAAGSALHEADPVKILVINSGSSSIKYQLFDMSQRAVLAAGVLERIGEPASRLTHRVGERPGSAPLEYTEPVGHHREGIRLIDRVLRDTGVLEEFSALDGIGHRVVHGGEAFQQPTRVSPAVVEAIRDLIPLAPLHNPANLLGMEVALERAPQVPQVAVFDTAFHQTIPPHAFRYALPEAFYTQHGVRRYGFHGTSHRYVARQAARLLARPLADLRLITLHLGNGASATAVQAGRSIDTSMGLTPLEGLVMGTRCGDLDPAIVFFLQRKAGIAPEEMESVLNRDSGVKGICGVNDMRTIGERAQAGDPQARLALSIYCYRIKKYIGAYLAILGGLDALVFTGGIGENAAFVRAGVCAGLSHLGIAVDPARNAQPPGQAFPIHAEGRPVRVLVIPTNEELAIAEATQAVIRGEAGD